MIMIKLLKPGFRSGNQKVNPCQGLQFSRQDMLRIGAKAMACMTDKWRLP